MAKGLTLRDSGKRYDPMFSECPLIYPDKDAFVRRKKLSGCVRKILMLFAALSCLIFYRAAFLSFSKFYRSQDSRSFAQSPIPRGEIIDRNGKTLAVSLQAPKLIVNTQEILSIPEAKQKLLSVFPDENPDQLEKKLRSGGKEVPIRINLTPQQQQAVHDLGLPGVSFDEKSYIRNYASGSITSHIVGFTDKYGEKGLAGIEKKFNDQLIAVNPEQSKTQLTLDMRVQSIAYRALKEGVEKWSGVGGAAIVMNSKTGEILAMVSLPDFDPFDRPTNIPENRASYTSFEPGSTFKIVNAAIALETQTVNPNEVFQGKPFRVEKKLITDDQGNNMPKNMYEIIQKSSNIGSAQIALRFGPGAQQILFKRFGLTEKPKIELEENSKPIMHQPKDWGRLETAKVASGLTVTVSSLQAITAFTSMINGGYYVSPTFIPRLENQISETNDLSPASLKYLNLAKTFAQKWHNGAGDSNFYKQLFQIRFSDIPAPKHGERIISPQTSALLRDMARRVVESGTGRNAEVKGYAVIGKTGTANKPDRVDGGYSKNKRITAFAGAFPAYDPQYSVYVMVDEPQHLYNKEGLMTRKAGGGSVAAPIAKEIIERLAPMVYVKPFRSKEPDSVRREITLRAEESYRKNAH